MRAVIFDLDDTLHDKTANLIAMASFQYTTERLHDLGINAQQWEYDYVEINNIHIPKPEAFSRLSQKFQLNPSLGKKLLEDFLARFSVLMKPFDGVFETLEWCRAQEIKLGIVTNGADRFQRSKLQGMGFTGMFDAIITSGEIGIKKPDLRIFRTCLDRLEVEPQDVIFIGDDFEADMKPAIQLGMHTIWKSDITSPAVNFSSNNFSEIRNYLSTISN